MWNIDLKQFDTVWVITIVGALAFGFWRLKSGFRGIFSLSARKHARKMRFYKPCTSAASESEFELLEQNSAPESRLASLHTVKVIKMSMLTINRFLILWSLHGSTTGHATAFGTLAYPFKCSRLKIFCLRRTGSTQIDLMWPCIVHIILRSASHLLLILTVDWLSWLQDQCCYITVLPRYFLTEHKSHCVTYLSLSCYRGCWIHDSRYHMYGTLLMMYEWYRHMQL